MPHGSWGSRDFMLRDKAKGRARFGQTRRQALLTIAGKPHNILARDLRYRKAAGSRPTGVGKHPRRGELWRRRRDSNPRRG